MFRVEVVTECEKGVRENTAVSLAVTNTGICTAYGNMGG